MSLATAGPPMFCSLVIAGVGQFLVALVFGEIVPPPWASTWVSRWWCWLRSEPTARLATGGLVPARRLGTAVTVGALVYGVLAMINIAWPRTPDAPWYDNWIVALGTAVVIGLGLLCLALGRPHEHSDAANGDAIEPRSTQPTTTGGAP